MSEKRKWRSLSGDDEKEGVPCKEDISVPLPQKKTVNKTTRKLLLKARTILIWFVLLSFVIFALAKDFGINLRTNWAGKVIDSVVLGVGSAWGIFAMIVMALFVCVLLIVSVFALGIHILELISKDKELRIAAWKRTKKAFLKVGKVILTWAVIICAIVGFFTIIEWDWY